MIKLYVLTDDYSTAWFNSDTADVVGKMVVATMRDENGNLKTTNIKVREVIDTEIIY